MNVYENGCVVMKESWDSIFGSGDCYGLLFTEIGMQLAIEDKASRHIVYVGNYNSQMQRHGRGIEYDPESGKEQFEGIWSNGKLQRILKFFDDDDRMIELSEDSETTDMSGWKPLFMGGYVYDERKMCFFRHGHGCKIDPKCGLAYSKGEWNMGEEVWSVELLDGVYLRQKIVGDEADLNQLSPTVEELLTLPGCCNKMKELNFGWFSELRSISFGDRCFRNVQTFTLNGMSQLQRLKIGNHCFTPPTSLAENGQTPSFASSFQISNCPVLRKIEIGAFSFQDYAGGFDISNLPALEELNIGIPTKNSSNFFHSDFILHGKHMNSKSSLLDLPKLQSVCLGFRSFCFAKQVKMKSKNGSFLSNLDLPSLCTIQLGRFALQGNHCNVILESSYLESLCQTRYP